MQFLVFIIAYPFFGLFPFFPFAFFIVGWRLFLVYYIIGYRKKVVRANLAWHYLILAIRKE
jgi:KDO2-lipid IV(A) lauroyltransferase